MTEGAQRPGEPRAAERFDDLFRREFAPITRTAYLVVGDWEVAREIAQDAFVQALRHWKKVESMAGERAASLRIAVTQPDVFATVVSQTPAVLIRTPHHDTNTSTVLIAVALLAGGVLLAGSAFWLGRRSRRPQLP